MEWLLVPVAYLAGSIQWGLYIVRLTTRIDVRSVGSGKTGATNVLRTSGKLPAALVFAADLGKGAGLSLTARAVSDNEWLHVATAAAVIVGHIWPVLAGFRGGRGVATGLGAAAGLDPWIAIVGLAIFAPVVGATRYVSLGSILAVLGAVGTFTVRAAVFDAPLPYAWFGVAVGMLLIFMHRDNIRRLVRGEERRIGRRVA